MSNYLIDAEMAWDNPKDVDRQIAIGLRTCKTVEQVMKLLADVREHERRLLGKAKETPK